MIEASLPGSLGPLQIIGVMGFLIYIAAFTAVQLELMNGNGITFSLANTLAAMLVALSLFADFNLASALIQGSWIVIGIAGIATRGFRATATRAQSGRKRCIAPVAAKGKMQ